MLKIGLAGLAAVMATASFSNDANAYGDKQWPQWYLGVHTQISYLDDADVEGAGANGNLEFDMGYGVGASIGYRPYAPNSFFDNTRLELSYTRRSADLDRVEGGGVTNLLDSNATQDEIMANIYYDFASASRWTPYIGAGIGVINVAYDDTSLGIDDNDMVFGYNGSVGLLYSIGAQRTSDFMIGYRYVGGLEAELVNAAGVGTDTEIASHSIEAGFQFRF